MAENLRAVFKPLLEELDLTETEFWEIERAGRLAGIFKIGRTGPGGGTPATLEVVVLAVIALLAGLTKRDGARLASYYASANYRDCDIDAKNKLSQSVGDGSIYSGRTKCGLTGAITFGQALEWVLYSPIHAARIVEVRIIHNFRLAQIEFRPENPTKNSQNFISDFSHDDIREGLVRATITSIQFPFFTQMAVMPPRLRSVTWTVIFSVELDEGKLWVSAGQRACNGSMRIVLRDIAIFYFG